jgi:L-iditol 2-dehydrogenase
MKAAVLAGIEKIELRETPEPEIKDDHDVLMKVNAVGVCGSDIHYYKTGRIGDQIIKYPFKIGHEFAATVEKTGSAVTRVKPGDLVAVDPAISCGECDQCLQGRKHTCRNLQFMGNPNEHDGCLSEYVVLPESCCYPLDENLDAIAGVLIEPLSIGNYAVTFIKDLPVKTAGILGAGPIGLSVLYNLRDYNLDKVFVTDKLDYRVENAKASGAYWSGNPDKVDVPSEISAQEPLLLDAVFECCGQQEAIDQAIEILKPGGHLILVGIPETDEIHFKIHDMRRKEITFHNVRRQNECMDSTINFLEGNKDVEGMITHKFSLDQIEDAFNLVASYGDGVIKAVIEFS